MSKRSNVNRLLNVPRSVVVKEVPKQTPPFEPTLPLRAESDLHVVTENADLPIRDLTETSCEKMFRPNMVTEELPVVAEFATRPLLNNPPSTEYKRDAVPACCPTVTAA